MREYKPIIKSLIRFFSIYLVFIGLYYLYLLYYQEGKNTCDPFTMMVGEQASCILNYLGFNSSISHSAPDNFVRLLIDGERVSIINEGCNALSVIILYTAFIISIPATKRKTILYLIITIIILHFFNILRVAALNYIYHFYSDYKKIAHDYAFPVVIYGVVIFLWLIWMKYFVLNTRDNKNKE